MTVSLPTLDEISGSATCQLFAAGAGIAAYTAVGSALTGQIWGVVGGGAGLLAANALAAVSGCFLNPDNPPPGPGKSPTICSKVDTGYFRINRIKNGEFVGVFIWNIVEIHSIDVESESEPDSNTGPPNYTPDRWTTYRVSFTNTDGELDTGTYTLYSVLAPGGDVETIETEFFDGAVCTGPPIGPGPDPDEPVGPPVEVPVPGTECTMSVRILETYINASGSMSMLYEGCLSGAENCSGCQRWWYHGPGQIDPAPPDPITDPDGDPILPGPPDTPWPKEQLDRIEKCSCQDKPLPVEIEGGEFVFTAACDKDDQGNLLQRVYPLEGAGTIATALTAITQRQDQMMQVLQQHLDWKTPTCSNRPELRGDWVTIEFESDERSPYGNTRLRKRFRYRSESSRELGELIEYWKDFSWSAGPVCVQHSGAWWGTPQCWAASAAEGKRVIQHAAREAGIDPNQAGKWTISGSDNTRYGVPGTMRIRRNKGTYCITNRLGASGLPLVGRVNTDPYGSRLDNQE